MTMQPTLDKKIAQATISIKTLIVAWFSIPVYYIVFSIVSKITGVLSFITNALSLAINGCVDALIVTLLGHYAEDQVSQSVSQHVTIGLIIFPVAIWLCWAIVYACLHFNYKLYYTNENLIGKAGKKQVNIPLKKINNIFVESSLWGKIFNYGTITITSNVGSISIKSVSNAKVFAKKLASGSIENENNFTNL